MENVWFKNICVDNEIPVYAVYDTKTEKYWVTPKGKWTWNSVGNAKNAVAANPPQWMIDKSRAGYPLFSEQDRLVITYLGKYTFLENEL